VTTRSAPTKFRSGPADGGSVWVWMLRFVVHLLSWRSVESLSLGILLLSMTASPGEINVVIEHHDTATASPGFTFKNIPSPSMNDAGTKAEFVLVDGVRDGNGGPLETLHDGKLPAGEDAPEENFFFRSGSAGGRLLLDLRGVTSLKQVNTYSWHPGPRGPQVYTLYASDGRSTNFNPRPKEGTQPDKCGWRLIAKVDTRQKHRIAGGQYGVSISDSAGTIGKYRYLLFVMSRTENEDLFGNTFYSEIDIIDADAAEPPRPIAAAPPARDLSQTFSSGGGKYQDRKSVV